MNLLERLPADFADDSSGIDADDIDCIHYTDRPETFKDKLGNFLKDLGGDIFEDIVEVLKGHNAWNGIVRWKDSHRHRSGKQKDERPNLLAPVTSLFHAQPFPADR